MTAHAIPGDWPGEIKWKAKRRHTRAGRGDVAWRVLEARGRGRGLPDPEDLERLSALREIRHGGGFGPGGPGGHGGHGGHGGPGGFGGGGPRGRGRRRRKGDVRAALLMLLIEEPMNGYQLMQTIEERSGGEWRPSPGSVYPSLSQLEDEGFIRATERDGTRVFEITDAGREHIAERHEEHAPWEEFANEAGGNPRRQMRHAIGSTAAAAMQVAQVGDDKQVARAIETLEEARRGLYRILAEDQVEDGEE
jgi:DNA-binding PadR family transcriptional regulator